MKNQASLCYNGQIKLKKAGVQADYTWEEVEELVKCRDSIPYFLENYIKIISLDKGLVNFVPYQFQIEMLDIMDKNRFSIFLLPRQMGKSITVAGFLLHQALFNDRYSIAILANKADQSREIMARIQLMYEELPWFMQAGVVTWNKGDIELGNGTVVFCAATSGSSIRGRSVNLVYLDEFAFVENDVEFYTSTYPVVTAGSTTKIIITSTPNGMNLFYKIWTDSVEGRNAYAHKQVHWSEHPDRNEAWKDEQLRNMSQKQFDQEFNCIFQGSADTLISGAKLQQLTFQEPIAFDENYSVFERPRKDGSYVVTVDVCEGIGKDYSVVNVIDVSQKPFAQVARYRSNTISPLTLAQVVNRIGTSYNNAVVVVETNSVGGQVTDALWYDYEYENLFTSKVADGENRQFEGRRSQLGVRTTSRTKLVGASQLKTLIESDTLIVKDFETIQELSTFIKHGKKYQAEKNKHDDIVMTLVMFAWFTTQVAFEEMTDLNIRAVMKENMTLADQYLPPVGFFDDGTEDQQDIGFY